MAYISGADLMMSKDLFESLDGFSNDFFMYYEETDLCYRVKKLGYKIQSVPDAQIIHLEGGSQKNDNINIWKISTMAHSRRVFMKRCHKIIYRLIDFGLMYFLLWFKYIIKPDNRQVAAEFKEFKQTL